MKRLTHKNPDGTTYRVPLADAGEFRVMHGRTNAAVFGDIVNRLGRYEDLMTIEEAERIHGKSRSGCDNGSRRAAGAVQDRGRDALE